MENFMTRIIVSGITAAVGYQIYDTIVGIYQTAFNMISLGVK